MYEDCHFFPIFFAQKSMELSNESGILCLFQFLIIPLKSLKNVNIIKILLYDNY